MSNYTNPADLIALFNGLARRIANLERTNPLNYGTIDYGGLTIKGSGLLQWIDANDNLAFRIRTLNDTGEDANQDSIFEYFYPYEDYENAIVRIGTVHDPDGNGNSHGIEVRSYNTGSMIFNVSNGGIIVAKRGKQEDTNGNEMDDQYLLFALPDDDDFFQLYLDSKEAYFRIQDDSDDAAKLYGGIASAGDGKTFATSLRLKGTGGISTPGLDVLNENSGGYADIDCEDLHAHSDIDYVGTLTDISSGEVKEVYGESEIDGLDAIMHTTVKEWSYIRTLDNSDETYVEDKVRIGPIAEEVPDHLFVPGNDKRPAGIDVTATLWTAVMAIQQLQARVEELQTEVATLKGSS